MHLDKVLASVAGIPHMSTERGKEIYEFVRQERPKSVLELGFAHGVSACYIGAALKDNGSGQLTTIDVHAARDREPCIEELLQTTDLLDWVRPIYTPTSYTWDLMQMLEQQRQGEWTFDFAFIDGAHSWFVDGLAFFLVDKLLKPGGWMLFDDLDWTYATSPTLGQTDFVRSMPEDERNTPQIGKVFELLVAQHPGYDEFRNDGAWGWARKAII
ncbi:class I SAM-dependent methyltransferase [Dactylosporangium sp. NPDC051485]|uniref:class I SAM-dependent methyltransferase n=1 Tax=Dactylosporangium sp. NPDC051485 TaxID=3154846 RepID=UPI0034136EAF